MCSSEQNVVIPADRSAATPECSVERFLCRRVIQKGEWGASVDSEREKLEHQIQLATRAASYIADESTARRLLRFAEQLRQRLFPSSQRRQTRARAYKLWEEGGRPAGRDLEFWLAAEREINPPDDQTTLDNLSASQRGPDSGIQ